MITKKCFKCGMDKELTEFYKHPQMADGHLNKCKECNKKDVKENYKAKENYYKEFDRIRNQNPNRKAYIRDNYRKLRSENRDRFNEYGKRYRGKFSKDERTLYQKEQRDKHRLKYRARWTLADAIKSGKIIKSSKCEECGLETNKLHGHHNDYTKPLDVKWLCTSCHGKESWL